MSSVSVLLLKFHTVYRYCKGRMLAHPRLVVSAVLPTRRLQVRCALGDADELWEEELEQLDHLQYMATQAKQIDALKEIVRPDQRALGSTWSTEEICITEESTAAHACEDANILWNEDMESMELLREAAALNKQVGELRSIASKDLTSQAPLRKLRSATPPTMSATPSTTGQEAAALPLPLSLLAATNLGTKGP